MKTTKTMKRAISLLLTLAMMLGMLPSTALAAAESGGVSLVEYKGMSMVDFTTGEWVSQYHFSPKPETLYFDKVNLTPGQSLARLSFSLEIGQEVSLALYKMTDGCELTHHQGKNGSWDTYDMPFADSADIQEAFLGEFMGYLYATPMMDNIKLTDAEEGPEAEPIFIEDWKPVIKNYLSGDNLTGKRSLKTIYGYGWTGEKLIIPEPEEESAEEDLQLLQMVMEGNGPAFFALDEDDGFIQNHILWDGSYITESGQVVSDGLEDGLYVIVLTPTIEDFAKYNTFLGFEATTSSSARFTAGSYKEPELTVNEYAKWIDPVNMVSGSFSWEYTDFSLYGKHDLPFTRYYESVNGEHDYGLGLGWTTDYTAKLETFSLFARVTLPQRRRLTFDIQPDGSYKPAGDYTFAATGSGYALTDTKDGTVRQFNAEGYLTQIRDTDGNTVNLTWNGGNMTGISNSSGSLTLAYDGNGHIQSVTDSTGRSIALFYTGDYLTAVENPDGDSLRYTYDTNGYLATVENFKGQVYVRNTYNADGQVVHQYAANMGTFDFTYDPDARHNVASGTDGTFMGVWYDFNGWLIRQDTPEGSMYFTWDDKGQKTAETDRNGKTTRYAHDAAGNISQITYPDGTTEKLVYNADRKVTKLTDRNGASTSYTYDANGNVTSVTDGRGNTTTYGYTGGYLTSVTDPLGNETTFTNDIVGNRTSMTDAQGNVTTYTYDGQGRLTSQTAPDGSVTTYEYTEAGKLVKVTDTQGNQQTYTVDGNGFNTAAGDWMGNVTTYQRNTQNQITKVTDPLGNATTYGYDDRGNLAVSTDARGNQTTYTYDAAGRMTSMTDAMGNTWTYAYDNEGRRTSTTDPAGGTTATAYDSVGRPSAVTDAKGGKTAYTYDNVGNTTAVKDALNQTTRYTYDANGNMTSRTDRNGKTWTYAYDANNRLVSETDPLGGVTAYEYDELGRVTKTTTPGGAETTADYDSMGRTTGTANALGHATAYEYDSLGRRTKVTYADGTSISYTYNANGQVLTATDQLGGVTAYAYDDNGRLTSTTDPKGGVTAYTYDSVGNVTQITDALGNATTYTFNANNQIATVTDAEGGKTTYTYDALGRVSALTDAEGGKTAYTYDPNGNVTKAVDAEGNSITYTYDKLDRLTSATDGRGNQTTYAYDAEGNLTQVTDPAGYSASRSYDALGRLVAENDRNGNTRAYTYDADGRLTSSTDPLGNVTTYTYDAMGNLLTQTNPLERVNSYTYDEMGRRTSATDPLGHVVTFYYDDAGRLTGYANKDGATVGYTYDANGNRLTVTDELGNVTAYTYDATNRLTSVTDPMGGVTSYAYDKVGNLISTTDALGNVTSQTYDKVGNLTSQTDALGNVTTYAYDKLGRCTAITDPNSGVISAGYDAAGNIVSITDPEGHETTYSYNARNELTAYTDAEGNTFSYAYDGNGNIVSYTDGNGNVTTYTYDGLDRAVERTNAEGNTATNEYDAAGRLVKATNEEGAVTTYTYDKDDRLLSMTDALGNVTSFQYDSMDRVTKVTDALGNSTTYTYDALGRVVSSTNAKGVVTTYTYDALGNRLTATDAAGTTSYAYDALGRVTAITDRNGNTQSFTYDASGQITKVTDKNGNETAYTYDPNGNIVKTTDALGTDVLFEYNANDQLIKMTQSRVDDYHEQAETLVTLYEYDGRNLVTKVVRSSGSQELYTYDGNGNMTTKTDGDGYVTEYSYNSLDLVSHINYNGAKEVSYQYNAVGELVRMDDWLGTTTFEVDLLGRLKKVTDHKGEVVSYTYDAVGNQTSVTYPDETTVTRTYDEVYNLTNVKDAENENYTYTYDDAGRVTKLTYPNGWIEEYTYDSEGNLLKTVDTDPFHNNKKSTKYEYAYDAEGNLISEYKRETTVGNRAMTTTYTYDALNRIISAHEVAVSLDTIRTYQYDTLGNLIRQEQDGCEEYKYNGFSLDESKECGVLPGIIGTCRWEYTYDGRGNLVSEDKYTRTTTGMDWQNVATYVYDETNHMVEGKNEDGEYSLYTYNGLGVRVARELIMADNTHGYTDFHSETPSVESGLTRPEVVKESYVIDYTSPTFNALVMDEVGGFNYRYVYGLDRLSVKITSEGTNWWGQHTTNNILKDYYHQDRLGSTTNMTDTYGRVVGRADYNEWGQITYREALDITSSYRRIYPQLNYTGHDWDDVLGMYYAKARFYSADDKRFVAMDPVKGNITEPLSLVSYLYCVDNPLRWVDPLGLETTRYEFGNEYGYELIDLKTKTIAGEKYASLNDLLDLYGFTMDVAPDVSPDFAPIYFQEQSVVYEEGGGYLRYQSQNTHKANGIKIRTGSTTNPSVDRQRIEITINDKAKRIILKNADLGEMAVVNFIQDDETGKYFVKVSCFSDAMGKVNYAKMLKAVGEQKITVNNWLEMYTTPTKEGGRVVQIPDDMPNTTRWFAYEGRTDIGNNAKPYVGDNYAYRDSNGVLTDKDGRYWAAYGPLVVHESLSDVKIHGSDGLWADEMKYGTQIDAVFEGPDGKVYYLRTTIGEAKANTYPNGIYQTGYTWAIPHVDEGHHDGSVVEFIGTNQENNGALSMYKIIKLIVYDNE